MLPIVPDVDADQPPAQSKRPVVKWIGLVVLVWVLVGALHIFAWIFHYQYFPEPNWLSRTAPLAWISGLSMAGFFTAAVLFAARREAPKPIRNIVNLCFSFVFGLYLGQAAVIQGGPMIIAVLVGRVVEIPFTVVHADGWGDSKCQRPIKLKLPVLFDELCRYPEDFRQSLQPGDRIILSGLGTRWGLFVTNAKKIE